MRSQLPPPVVWNGKRKAAGVRVALRHGRRPARGKKPRRGETWACRSRGMHAVGGACMDRCGGVRSRRNEVRRSVVDRARPSGKGGEPGREPGTSARGLMVWRTARSEVATTLLGPAHRERAPGSGQQCKQPCHSLRCSTFLNENQTAPERVAEPT